MTMSSVAGMSRRKNEPSLVLAEMEVKVTFVKRMSPEPRLASMRPMLALLAWRERVGGRRYAAEFNLRNRHVWAHDDIW